jgi:hypothetical protein
VLQLFVPTSTMRESNKLLKLFPAKVAKRQLCELTSLPPLTAQQWSPVPWQTSDELMDSSQMPA